MLAVKYLLEAGGLALIATAGAFLLYGLYRMSKAGGDVEPPQWHATARLAGAGIIPLLAGLSIAVVPAGFGGVRVSEVSGTIPGTLYPGLHFVFPLVQSVALYDIRDQIFETTLGGKPNESLKVQTKQGLPVGLAVAVRYRIDPQRLSFVEANLPQPSSANWFRPSSPVRSVRLRRIIWFARCSQPGPRRSAAKQRARWRASWRPTPSW